MISGSAEEQASQLSALQVLEIAYVWRNKSMKYGLDAEPVRWVRLLIEADILSFNLTRSMIVPGYRFNQILYALMRSGRIREPEVSEV